jgi:hypothetical protein
MYRQCPSRWSSKSASHIDPQDLYKKSSQTVDKFHKMYKHRNTYQLEFDMLKSSTLSARLFNQDTGNAKKMALDGPVVITNNGEPSHVLLSYQHFKNMLGPTPRLSDMLSMRDADTFDFEPHILRGKLSEVSF